MVTVWSVWNSYRFAEKQREKIYVLDNGKSLMLALSQDLSQNLSLIHIWYGRISTSWRGATTRRS